MLPDAWTAGGLDPTCEELLERALVLAADLPQNGLELRNTIEQETIGK